MSSDIQFTESEIKEMARHPDVLEALADWHDGQESQADGMGITSSAEFHRTRRRELMSVSDRIRREWEG